MSDLIKSLKAVGLRPIVIDENTYFSKDPVVQILILHKINSDFRAETDGTYKLVAVMELEIRNELLTVSDILEWAFGTTNHIDSDWTEGHCVRRVWRPCRSSSVGDIFVLDGRYYVVNFCGFKEV